MKDKYSKERVFFGENTLIGVGDATSLPLLGFLS